jgi:hypothetical protein
LVEDRSIHVLGKLTHLQLEVINSALGLLLLALEQTRRMFDGDEMEVLELLRVGDESRLANLRVGDAPLQIEVGIGETLVEGFIDLGEALGDGILILHEVLL